MVVYDNRYVIFLIKKYMLLGNNVADTNICPGRYLFNQCGGDVPIVKQWPGIKASLEEKNPVIWKRTSCIGCGSGFQPRSFNFEAGSRSYRGLFYGNWDFPDKRLKKY